MIESDSYNDNDSLFDKLGHVLLIVFGWLNLLFVVASGFSAVRYQFIFSTELELSTVHTWQTVGWITSYAIMLALAVMVLRFILKGCQFRWVCALMALEVCVFMGYAYFLSAPLREVIEKMG